MAASLEAQEALLNLGGNDETALFLLRPDERDPQREEEEDKEGERKFDPRLAGLLDLGDIFLDPDSAVVDRTPVSHIFALLVDEEEGDMHLRLQSIIDLVMRFFQEFDSPALQEFGLEMVAKYFEEGRLSSEIKLIAGMGLLLNAASRLENQDSKLTRTVAALVYSCLHCGTLAPLNYSDETVLEPLDIFLISRLVLAGPESEIWNCKIYITAKKWTQEYEDYAQTDIPIEQIILQDLNGFLLNLQCKLTDMFLPPLEKEEEEKSPIFPDLKGDREHELAVALRDFYSDRMEERKKIQLAHKKKVTDTAVCTMIAGWETYKNMWTDLPKNCIDEILAIITASQLQLQPEPTATTRDMVWVIPSAEGESLLGVGCRRSSRSPEGTDIEQELMTKALLEALTITERKDLLEDIARVKDMARYEAMTPDNIPALVENNPIIAIEALSVMIKSDTDVQPYFDALIKMKMSVHSIEVVNVLSSKVHLPKDFVQQFISSCIKVCEGIEDKYVQSRLVRLLCVFIHSLLRSEVIEIQDVYVEVLVFLLSFSRVREAATLFRHIRQFENEDNDLRELVGRNVNQPQEPDVCSLTGPSDAFPHIPRPYMPRDRDKP